MPLRGKLYFVFLDSQKKRSIVSLILIDILQKLDSREIFDCSKGRFLFLLLDRYSSSTKLVFLKYTNNSV